MTAVTENIEQEAPVLFNTEPTECGHLIGIMMLNTPKSLNALSVEMCQLLAKQLEQWQNDDHVQQCAATESLCDRVFWS